MYEESFIPQKLPGGGGFSIKNLSLQSLYIEHIHGHNIFTKTNKPYQLVRYIGCKIKMYQSKDIDYIISYSNTWPLKSSLLMYNSMQPAIHALEKNKIIVPSKETQRRKRPYRKAFIPPPTQMINKWYFQADIANKPLFMLRTSSCSLDHWYIGTRMESTNITITSLNTFMLQNRQWGSNTIEYSNRTQGTLQYYLYTSKSTETNPDNIPLKSLVFLSNTKDHVLGESWEEYLQHKPTETIEATWFQQYQTDRGTWGNPFHEEFLKPNEPVYTSHAKWATILTKLESTKNSGYNAKVKDLTGYTFTKIDMTYEVRYNPYKDDGVSNECYFLSTRAPEHGWDPPTNTDLTNENLPLWILLYGFADFQKKLGKRQHIDTDYILVVRTQNTQPNRQILAPISMSFIEGWSPYETEFNPLDQARWFPGFQYQQEINNEICLCGPGTPKINKTTTAEAKIEYKFIFKWGGELPPMDLIDNPSEKPSYPVPSSKLTTNSLQNPTQRPETMLYPFDERQGFITKKAAKRICKDWTTKEASLLSTGPRFAESPQTQETQETSSSEEEEEENLFQQLINQRAKQQRLKQRILLTIQKLAKSQ